MSVREFLVAAVFVIACGVASQSANAQHANFVLFGDPSPEAAQVAPEHRFVHPVTDPYDAEDSFVTSDIRFWFLQHNFPDAGLMNGGEAQVYAAQIRVALTNTLQLVAYKDGYVQVESGLINDSGTADIAAGLKWNFIQDWENQFHMAVGVGYEFKTGEGKVLQNDDQWRLWLSANKGFGRFHIGGNVNFYLVDNERDSLGNADRFTWHLHMDYYVCKWFSPVIEINGYHVMDEGAVAVPFQGVDIANLGGGKDEDVITLGIGAEIRPFENENIALRAAFQTPLTHDIDLYGRRWTISAVLGF